jgi:glycosyltransferase involved in cell wall biosynthesis
VRIVLGTDTYPPNINGAARFTERLATGLLGRGHEVHVVAPSPTGHPGIEERDGVLVHRMRSHRFAGAEDFFFCLPWETRPAVARTLARVAPDVAHTQAHFVCGRYLAYAAADQSVPLVATNHFMPENLVDQVHLPHVLQSPVSRLAWADLARVYRRAQVVTAPTPRAVELLERAAGLPGALAISCGIDIPRYEEAARRTAHDAVPTILFVGRLEQEKRVEELIAAFAALPTTAAALEIVGDGALRGRLEAQAAVLGVADRVTFRGFVSEEELLEAYGRSDIFCMPGVAELQSLVTLEAMSAGRPVVAADAMALPHLVRPGHNGWLFTPGDVDGLSARLAALVADGDLRTRMGAASREMVAAHGLSQTLDRFEALYRQVTGLPAEVAEVAEVTEVAKVSEMADVSLDLDLDLV